MRRRLGLFTLPAILCLAAVSLASLAAQPKPAAGSTDDVAAGRALYLQGRRGDGTPLTARRAGGLVLAGAEAACVSCHRRSGMGGAEGRIYIPPVTASALFHPVAPGKGASPVGIGRAAYDEASLAHALRGGVDPGGRPLDYLMPRYELQERDVRALAAYLQQRPGAAAQAAARNGPLHFATVIAPDTSQQQRQAMLGVLQACIDEHNAGPATERGRKRLAGDISVRRQRDWQLHTWTLQDAESTWEAQLQAHAGRQQVFAILGGIGGGRWSPVHAFCEKAAVPCLFPHIEAPVATGGAFYPLYLGKGVALEAALVAGQLRGAAPHARRIVQVLRASDASARAGADALRQALADHGTGIRSDVIELEGSPDVQLLASVGPQDALMLWLRPPDLQQLGTDAPPGAQVFLSATLAERDEVALPAAWKERAVMAYPFELPHRRAGRGAAEREWLRARGLAPGDERVQSDAYVACGALRAAMNETEEHLDPDYLVERIEANMERRTASGLYPRLSLGVGQRFASKSGYLVRFDAGSGDLQPVAGPISP